MYPFSLWSVKHPTPKPLQIIIPISWASNLLHLREALGTHLLPRQLQPLVLLLAICWAIGTSKPEKVIALKVTELFPQLTYGEKKKQQQIQKQKSHHGFISCSGNPKAQLIDQISKFPMEGFFVFCSQPRTVAEERKKGVSPSKVRHMPLLEPVAP